MKKMLLLACLLAHMNRLSHLPFHVISQQIFALSRGNGSAPLIRISVAGEMRPPLTVVLVNNGGGGIFDFLPIADEVPKDTFTQLWSTPQNVDLAGPMLPHP